MKSLKLDAVELVGLMKEGPGEVDDFEGQAWVGGAA